MAEKNDEMTINRSPCASCPYRCDVPSGVWDASEYEKIKPFDAQFPVQPMAWFLCHYSTGALCRGWLDCHGDSLLIVRLGIARGDKFSEALLRALDEKPAVAVFRSAAAAARHGRRDISNPGKRAVVFMDRILKTRGRKSDA